MKLKSTLLIGGIVMCLILFSSSNSSAITAVVKGNMPSVVNEASGLDFSGTNDYWTLEDAGGGSKIYRVNSSAALKQTVTINEASNYDWEDLTHNTARTKMFIGDFGNNLFSRKNLKIYKIAYPNSSTTSLTPSVINFSYPDQKKFPSTWKNFDVEGFIYMNDKLFLFTKGEGSAIGYTKMYSLPDEPGTYVAKLVDSFYVNTRITGAAISPDEKSVVLISNTQIHLFRNFTDDNIFSGQYKKITISGSWTQKEGVTFTTNSMIYLADEGVPNQNKLYSVDLSAYIIAPRLSAPENINEPAVEKAISAYPNPASSFVNIELGETYENVVATIANLNGQIVKRIEFFNPGQAIRLETDLLPNGMYAIQISGDSKRENSIVISLVH